MKVGAFMVTLGLGMIAGATAAMMLPYQSSVRKAAQKAADTVEQTVSKMTDAITN